MSWQDKEFLNRMENVVEQATRGECSPRGAADQALELAYDWLEKIKQDWQKTKQCAE